MAREVCFLCRASARISKEYDQRNRSLLTNVDCPVCGPYALMPHAWTNHERACLAAYVKHEHEAKRRPPVIQSVNWETLVRLGDALLDR